jgi:hypothetical protein
MSRDNGYPDWICKECAKMGNGRIPTLATFHDNICGVCNEWKNVTEPRDYGYPNVKSNWNKEKIISELKKAIALYIVVGDKISSEIISDRINHVAEKT